MRWLLATDIRNYNALEFLFGTFEWCGVIRFNEPLNCEVSIKELLTTSQELILTLPGSCSKFMNGVDKRLSGFGKNKQMFVPVATKDCKEQNVSI